MDTRILKHFAADFQAHSIALKKHQSRNQLVINLVQGIIMLPPIIVFPTIGASKIATLIQVGAFPLDYVSVQTPPQRHLRRFQSRRLHRRQAFQHITQQQASQLSPPPKHRRSLCQKIQSTSVILQIGRGIVTVT